ncbi:hypothetical protein FH972_007903 [Carpinus fangiana]|uniref:Uncharacterized protein n=1 Tax=Carpinus fangiana TaxID=176857 RepID=A0A5N6QX18_9ROSI|nr:hypothetical protein FH972_007903 [Carpinus fangiana]
MRTTIIKSMRTHDEELVGADVEAREVSPRDRRGSASSLERRESKPQTKSFPNWRDRLRKLRSSGVFPDFEASTREDKIFIRKLLAWLRKLRCSNTEARCKRHFWFVITGGEVFEDRRGAGDVFGL